MGGWYARLMKLIGLLPVQNDRNIVVRLEVARTAAERARGLSDREPMIADMGMLFPFDRDTQQSFTAEHMRFPLDVIFLDADNRPVSAAQNVAPGTREIRSSAPYRTVLELVGGTIAAQGIDLTRPAQFLVRVDPEPVAEPGLLGFAAWFGLGTVAKGAVIGGALRLAKTERPWRAGMIGGLALQSLQTVLGLATRPRGPQFEATKPAGVAFGALIPEQDRWMVGKTVEEIQSDPRYRSRRVIQIEAQR